MNVAIIGAGASGLFLANMLEKLNIQYTIFEGGKTGRKILASGNGRCNISNKNLKKEYYHNSPLAAVLIEKYSKRLYEELLNLKIYTKEDEEGRMYPLSESSQSVLNALLNNIHGNIVNEYVTSVKRSKNKYFLNNEKEGFDYVALGIGTCAGFKKSPDFSVLDSFELKQNRFAPSLSGFKLVENVKMVSGVRAKAAVSLYEGEKLIHKEDGEVVFKDDGISGICIMNLSSYYNHINKNKAVLKVSLTDKEYDSYITVLNPKMLDYVKNNHLNPSLMTFKIKGTYDFEFSQVASGGVTIDSLDDSLRLKSDNHIFMMGEMIDVDGLCGGYNLSFAFLCAIAVSEVLKNEISD